MRDDLRSRIGVALADRYAIGRELGRGGMATVYLATDLKHERDVAIKVLRPELASVLGPERFLREIKTTAKLNHPHILPLLDSGDGHGLLFYVMPYVEGESLRRRLEREPRLPIDDAIQIAREVGDALSYAHSHGVIHRDIKPENVLLAAGHARVADFGIGKALSATDHDETLTQTGVRVGTPAYMSPEQAAGAAVDGRSDLYSLGCLLYEMLVGEPPFSAPTPEALIAMRFTHTPPPSATARGTVPPALSRAIARLMERAPADRFATAADFVQVLSSGPGTTPPASDTDDKSIAVLPFANMSPDAENAFFSDGITEEIINALAQIPGLRVTSRMSSFYFKGRAPEMAEVAAKLSVSTVLLGSVRRVGERLRITVQLVDVTRDEHIWSERYDRTMDDVFAVQDEIAAAVAERMRASFGPDAAVRLAHRAPSDLRAYELYLEGRSYLYQRGMGVLKGLQRMQQALEIDPDYGMALAGMVDANTLLALYGGKPAAELRQATLDAARRVVSVAPDLAEGHNAMACTELLFEWNWPAAEASFLRALELNPAYVQSRAWYALFYLSLVSGRFDDAIEHTARCIAVDPLSGYAHSSHALTLAFGDRAALSTPFVERAMALDPDAFLTHITAQICHYAAGRLDESTRAGGTALAFSGRHPWSLAHLCVSLVDARRHTEARAVYAELTSRAITGYVQPFKLAQGTAAIGEADAAIAYAEQAHAERDPALVLFGRHWKPAHHLRSDSRFADVLQSMNLPTQALTADPP